ncbi:MAG TPA: metal ABC transporter substrate-binding protein [Firmicutes bacterium]|nr:metal ABC transporter substrate-binding protein [Bacillota bacterium]
MTKSDRRRYAAVALLMGAILLVSAVITAFTRVTEREDGRLRLVAASYPVYIAALNVADGVDGVQVVNLVPSQAGCLHDYQLSPDNMITLSGADALILNGAGAESFLDGAREQFPELAAIDTSEGVPLVESRHVHEHDHGHDGEDGPAEEEAVCYNEHIWTSPGRYRRQVENLRDGLQALDPDHAAAYAANAEAYLSLIDAVYAQLRDAAGALPTDACITFHDSLTYFAEDLGLRPVAALSIGEEAGVSASDIRAAEQAAARAGAVLLLYDSQYPEEYAYIADSAERSLLLTLNMAAGGGDEKNAWLEAMEQNVQALRAAAS